MFLAPQFAPISVFVRSIIFLASHAHPPTVRVATSTLESGRTSERASGAIGLPPPLPSSALLTVRVSELAATVKSRFGRSLARFSVGRSVGRPTSCLRALARSLARPFDARSFATYEYRSHIYVREEERTRERPCRTASIPFVACSAGRLLRRRDARAERTTGRPGSTRFDRLFPMPACLRTSE